MKQHITSAAYGGEGWSPRVQSLREEIGAIWRACGIDSEWAPLRSVLLHRPGPELSASENPDLMQMLAPLDMARAQDQHERMAQAYGAAGVTVHYVQPDHAVPPNLMFVADLLFMTPEGAIVGRPASTVRAGEERFVARRLAELGIPILTSVHGRGVFEGADAAWINSKTVLLATGLRTNAEGDRQVTRTLQELGVEVIPVGLAFGSMHLMGDLRFLDRNLALAWPGRVPFAAVMALHERGYRVLFAPDLDEARYGSALNFVTLGPRRILMSAGNPRTQALLEEEGVTCHTIATDELIKAAGGIGCMTGILERQRTAPEA